MPPLHFVYCENVGGVLGEEESLSLVCAFVYSHILMLHFSLMIRECMNAYARASEKCVLMTHKSVC